MRLALSKYFKSKQCSTYLEAFQVCFSKDFMPAWQQFDCHKTRVERYWRQENDIVLKRLDPIVKALFGAHSGKYATSKTN